MSITYTWKIKGLKTQDQTNADGVTLQNAVVQTYWECTGTDADGKSGDFMGATPFTAENTPEGLFVPFASLTEETVLTWIKALVTGDYLDHVQGKIQAQINEASVKDADLPWAEPDARK